ncbi:MAG: Tetratricopeptide 1 repeat-containing protein [Parcubacteria group bacterium]|nr:Tetratricopeptide 1 repeat-containing protein [Parcubacteria group bacterium]
MFRSLAKGIGLVIVLVGCLFAFRASFSNSDVVKAEGLAIEKIGLSELSSEFNIKNSVTSEQKQISKDVLSAIELAKDGKDSKKNEEAVSVIDKLLVKYPDFSTLYTLKSTFQLATDDPDYVEIKNNIDKAIKYSSTKNKKYSAFETSNSLASLYSLRAKTDLALKDYGQAMKDLEIGVKINPNDTSDMFNTGGVKPEEVSNPTALQKTDLDTLVNHYPNDYLAYMFRGLFYSTFTSYDEKYFSPTLDDLQQALKLNPGSALVEFLLGRTAQKGTFLTKAAWADVSGSGGFRDKVNAVALKHFQNSIKNDPTFTDAYAQIAESFYSLKQYSDAIPYYDKVIELTPDNAGAYNDRGLSKDYTKDYYGAISDFTTAITKNQANPMLSSLYSTYENRAKVNIEVGNYDNAIDDYGKAIGVVLSNNLFLMSLEQIRDTYPELTNISDKDLLEGLRQKYFPNMSSADFVGQYQKNTNPNDDFILAGLYADRAATYLNKGDYKNASSEYKRALRYDKKYVQTMDRWKMLSNNGAMEYRLDIETLDFSKGSLVDLWLKSTDTNLKTSVQQNLEIDCAGRRVKPLSSTAYDISGNAGRSSGEQDWQNVIPESLGEILYKGACS